MGAVHALRVKSEYKLLKIENIEIENKPNEHGYLYLKCLIDDLIEFQSTINASTDDKICVYEELEDNNTGSDESPVNINVVNEDKSKILFNGIVQNIRTTNVNGVYYLEIQALTSSFELDIKEKNRSFQNPDMTYDDLIGIILKDYSDYRFVQNVGFGEKIGKPLFQYKESDWCFLKRIASELKSELFCDIIEIHNMFYFGRPSKGSYELEDTKYYNAHKKLQTFRDAGGDEEGYHDTDYFYYEIEKRDKYEVGDDIYFRNKDFYVNQYSAYALKDEVIYKYRLCRKNGVWQTKIYNSLLQGVSLEGKVLAVEGEKVKLHLNIDENQNEDEASWFPYAPPTGNIMYCMPIVGTSARLYFPNESSEVPIVTGCVRNNGSSCAKTADTTKRYLGTEHGSEIEMIPDAINIKGGSSDPISIKFEDNVGVTLTSHKKLTINADDDIIMTTPKNVKINATSQLLVAKTGTQSGFSMETDINFLSDNVIKNGRDSEASAPFDDEPKQGQKPKPPEPVKQEEQGFDWGKLALAAAAAVVIVASVLTFGLVATLVVAAVGAIVVSAAVGAMESGTNNINAQLAENGGDNSKIDYGEVLKAEFFGAMTGATDMAKTEVCATADWSIQTFLGTVGILNEGSRYLPWNSKNMMYQLESDEVAKDINNYSNNIHQFFKDKAPYKTAFEDAEFVLDVAMITDGVKSIGNIVSNLPGKFSIGELSLAEMGVKVPVLCVDGSAAMASAGDLASITGASGAIYKETSTSDGGSGGDVDVNSSQTNAQKVSDILESAGNDDIARNISWNDFCRYIDGKGKYSKSVKAQAYYKHTGKMDKINEIDYGKYLETYKPKPQSNPGDMWHAHHILYKKGIGAEQQILAEEGAEILRRNNIDTVLDTDNLVWAQNKAGQHNVTNLQEVVDELRHAETRAIERYGSDSEKIEQVVREKLRELGEIAENR